MRRRPFGLVALQAPQRYLPDTSAQLRVAFCPHVACQNHFLPIAIDSLFDAMNRRNDSSECIIPNYRLRKNDLEAYLHHKFPSLWVRARVGPPKPTAQVTSRDDFSLVAAPVV